MKQVAAFWILLFVAMAQGASAGLHYVPEGPVSGKWETGDSVIVGVGAFIEPGGFLTVEPGVDIMFEGLPRFEIAGRLVMQGEALNPINIYCEAGWRGFRFEGAAVENIFDYVNILPDAGLADRAIEVLGQQGSKFTIRHCNVMAQKACLDVHGGELTALDNKFVSTGLYSKVVKISALNGERSDDCDMSPGNLFRGNFLRALVDARSPRDPYELTVGLTVDQSTNICLTHNDITAVAPYLVAGVRFLNRPPAGDQIWHLHETIVYSESTTGGAIGIINEVDGDLEVTKATMTVRGVGAYVSTCFLASQTAHILINSSTATLGSERDLYFHTNGVGQVDADYVIKWVVEAPNLDGGGAFGMSDDFKEARRLDNNPNVRLGDSIWTVDPLYAYDGVWGLWETQADLRRFFSLTAYSPCIDRGDPVRGQDPDNTRWDIGRDYYDQSSSVGEPLPGVIESARLLPAYPNPFNPSTVLPIEVSHPGLLRVVVWDVLGREVANSAIEVRQAGLQIVHFDGQSLSSGTYFSQATFNGLTVGGQRLVLVK
ncbi:MAG: T9SS type A sorting domain-containing protein [Calditrichaeota bacterium]|nr:T9SS type A sorting domain-containing protein [Calditrichota bacterium]MCB9366752.1 T9SS type A sorting domain-containing protein [Calditrichota bacterium]